MDLADDYPILSIEDGFAEDDWRGWTNFTKAEKVAEFRLLVMTYLSRKQNAWLKESR